VKVELKSEASGRVDTLYVDEGSRLRKDQRILRIDPERLQVQHDKLKLNVEKAQLLLDMAKRDYENARQLAEYGKVAANHLDDLKNQMESGRIELSQNNLELQDIDKQLENTIIRSPMDGVLISLAVQVGEIVVSATSSNSAGTAIGTIADVSHLEVGTDIGEVDYPKIKTGMPVEISMASDPDRVTHGRVTFISLAAKRQDNSQVSNFHIRVSIDSLLAGMVPGINVNVDLVLMEKKNVLGVPFTMVTQQHGNHITTSTVIMASDSKPRKIDVGETDYKYFEVLSGLKEGEKVMRQPPAREKKHG
jgi:HlyD family secretion protein